MEKSNFTYVSFFSGLGAWDLGAYWAGARFNKHYFSEINPFACKVFKTRFPDAIALGDITKFLGFKGKSNFVFSASFPCIDLSLAGKRRGLQGKHSGLWFEFLRLVDVCKPLVVLVENVKDLASLGLDVVVSGLVEEGYTCNWRVISAADVGAPHLRERLWLVAYRNDLETGYVPFSFVLKRRIFVKTGRSVMSLGDSNFLDSYYIGSVNNDGLFHQGQPVGRNMPLGGFTRGKDVYAVLDWEGGLQINEVLEDSDDDNRGSNIKGSAGTDDSGGGKTFGSALPTIIAGAGVGHEDVANTNSSRWVRHLQHEEAGVRGFGLGCEQYSELEGGWDVKPRVQCMVNGVPWFMGVNGQPVPFPVTFDKRENMKQMLSCYGNSLIPQIAWIMFRRIKPFIPDCFMDSV